MPNIPTHETTLEFMNRKEALSLINQYVKNKNSIKHMLAVEAVMRSLARKFDENEDLWGIVGLVHDVDMETVDYENEPQRHGIEGANILEKEGVGQEILEAVKAHNKATGKNSETLMEKAIFCADPLTGLIVAGVLVLPSKKIADLTLESVLKRFKEKAFAKGANREIIGQCSEIGLDLKEFVEIGLKAMQEISDELEL